MKIPPSRLCLFSPFFAVLASPAAEITPEQRTFFENRIRPVLAEQCYRCHSHGAKKLKGDLYLDSRAAMLEGAESGPAVVPGDLEKSLLIEAVRYKNPDMQMPPKKKLEDGQIADLEKWVEMGAPWPGGDKPVGGGAKKEEFDLEKRRQEHWVWQPVVDRPAPVVEKSDWSEDPIDRFVLAKLEERGLSPAAEAGRRTLIRRVTYDLIGLPPEPEAVEAFVNDASPNAWEKVVDGLLASPHFGERWARHWMDLVRYAETCGHEFDYPIPHAHQYRDYLIRAFNADIPYNTFVSEHIAGDLLANPRRHPEEKYNESIIGTAFPFFHEATHAPTDVRGDEAGRVDNQIDVLTKTFLGVTVACARCHDHKFDAISTKDYYALAGYFQSSRRQEAMLDPGQRIASGVAKLRALKATGGVEVSRATAKTTLDGEMFARYLVAARDALSGQFPKSLNQAAGGSGADVVFEDFESANFGRWKAEGDAFGTAPAGRISNQKPLGKLLQGRAVANSYHKGDGSQGKLTSPQFKIERKYVRFVIGGGNHTDKTCINLMVDGKKVRTETGHNHDELREKGWDVGDFAGKTARLEIVDQHQGGWGHVLVDHIVFTDRKPKGIGGKGGQPVLSDAVHAHLAKKYRVETDALKRWTRALGSEAVKKPTHPLHAWAEIAKHEGAATASSFGGHREAVHKRLSDLGRRAEESEKESVKFADFEDEADFGGSGWFVTGEAFGDGPTVAGEAVVDGSGLAVAAAGQASSAKYARRLRGVLRSPTFTITHPNIHHRIKADGVQIRLIIDSYVMDVYNGLLFNNCSLKNVDTKGEWRWQSQGGNVGKYLGHRAHLEYIDHGDGAIALEEVWFSKGGPPSERPSEVGIRATSTEAKSLIDIARAYGAVWKRAVADWRMKQPSKAHAELVAWAINEGLVDRDSGVSEQVARAFAEAEKAIPGPMFVPALADGTAENEFVFLRGSHKKLGDEVSRRFLTALGGEAIAPAEQGSGRLSLAEQIIDPKNPLTSRVMVNRLWHHLFGRGIVPTTDDFGVLGQDPSNPELLDHLAATFVKRDGWSVKRMLKRIAMTQSYRMASVAADPKAEEADPNNVYHHRANVRRLQGEAIRDGILAISGRLDRKLYGGSVPVHLTSFMTGRGRPGSGPLDGHGRRSLYIKVQRNFLSPMMIAFDTPIPFSTMGRRSVSNVPAQALIMMNDPFVVQQAEVWAKRAMGEVETPEDRIRSMYARAFSRPPGADEIARGKAFIEANGGNDALPAWKDYAHVLMNTKEFVFIQ